jgi:hypothetical protein
MQPFQLEWQHPLAIARGSVPFGLSELSALIRGQSPSAAKFIASLTQTVIQAAPKERKENSHG